MGPDRIIEPALVFVEDISGIVLLVEDDPAIRASVTRALEGGGYRVRAAADAASGRRAVLEDSFDLVLLDLVLPGGDGLDILTELKAARPTVPVIILSALGDEADRVTGLERGADDYMVKPFGLVELLARVRAVLRRSPERPLDLVSFDLPEGIADLARREVRFADGERQGLSERETELLRYLAAHPGRAISRDELLERIWRLRPGRFNTRTIDMHVARLRAKLRDDPETPGILITVRGKGYMFGAPRCGP